ncbi:MAG: hypothetical protein JRK53_17425 [Deltaproteobacteria bacterium]|nr:hypothetical protein [Deltaproteobacteria bacterium]
MPINIRDMDEDPLEEALGSSGITADLLVREGKRLLRAEKTVFQKISKGPGPGEIKSRLPKGSKIVAETSREALIAIRIADLGARQRAIQELHKLRGDYPSDRVHVKLDGNVGIDVTQYSPEEREAYEKAARVAEEEIAEHRIRKRTK